MVAMRHKVGKGRGREWEGRGGEGSTKRGCFDGRPGISVYESCYNGMPLRGGGRLNRKSREGGPKPDFWVLYRRRLEGCEVVCQSRQAGEGGCMGHLDVVGLNRDGRPPQPSDELDLYTLEIFMEARAVCFSNRQKDHLLPLHSTPLHSNPASRSTPPLISPLPPLPITPSPPSPRSADIHRIDPTMALKRQHDIARIQWIDRQPRGRSIRRAGAGENIQIDPSGIEDGSHAILVDDAGDLFLAPFERRRRRAVFGQPVERVRC